MDFQSDLQLNLIRATAFQSSGEIGWFQSRIFILDVPAERR
jgi:hypothetical protein